MFVIKPSKTAYNRVENHPWSLPVMMVVLAILVLLMSFSNADISDKEKQDAEIKSLRNQVTRIISPVVLGPYYSSCAVHYAVVSFIIDPSTNSLDTIRFESNIPEKDQYKIKVNLGSTINIDWKTLAGEHSLANKVIKIPVLIRNTSGKCETKGTISPAEVARLLYGMLGTPETTPALIDRNIFLPLTEIVIVQYAGTGNSSKPW